MTKPLRLEELEEELCDSCQYTDFGTVKVNTGPWNLCEGRGCEQAYKSYLENFESEGT